MGSRALSAFFRRRRDAAVGQIETAPIGELGCGRGPDTRRRTLLHRLGYLGAVIRGLLDDLFDCLAGQVPAQVSVDETRVDRMGADACQSLAAVELRGEQHVGGLGLT